MSKKSFAALYAEVESTPAYQAEKLAVDFLAELNTFMQANNVSNAELARRAKVSPAYITKLFRGSSNLSIETLTKFAAAIDCKVHLHLAQQSADVRWFDVFQMPRPAQQAVSTNAANFAALRKQLKPAPVADSFINEDLFYAAPSAIAA